MAVGVPVGAAESGTTDEGVVEAVALLKKALDRLDRSAAPPELAARIQHAIDAAEQWRSASINSG